MQERKYRKRKLGSYPFISVIFSITLSLLMMGLFGLLALHTNRLSNIIKENIEIQVFLNKPIDNNEITRIQKTILSKSYVLSSENTENISFVSKEEAARQFVEETGEDFSQLLGDNPLRDLFIVKVDPDFQSVDSLTMIKKEIESIRGVYEVSYVETLVNSINKNLTKIGVILLGFSVIFLIVVVVLINNTIKLALFSQRFLIRSMQMVGATGAFIKGPFLKRAAFYGLVSGIVCSIILFALMQYANSRIEDLKNLQNDRDLIILFGSLIFVGIVVAYGSTLRAVRRYLKTSLDELY